MFREASDTCEGKPSTLASSPQQQREGLGSSLILEEIHRYIPAPTCHPSHESVPALMQPTLTEINSIASFGPCHGSMNPALLLRHARLFVDDVSQQTPVLQVFLRHFNRLFRGARVNRSSTPIARRACLDSPERLLPTHTSANASNVSHVEVEHQRVVPWV